MLDLSPPALPIRTARLVLRPFVVEDVDSVFSYRSRPDVVRYTYRAVHATREETMAYLGRNITFPKADGDWFALGVELPGRPGVIGEALLKFSSLDAEQGEIGYVFSPDAAGHGYATEAVTALVDLAFHHFGFHRLVARIDEANAASVRLAERLGMRLEARLLENDRLDGEWSTEVDYAILSREWADREVRA